MKFSIIIFLTLCFVSSTFFSIAQNKVTETTEKKITDVFYTFKEGEETTQFIEELDRFVKFGILRPFENDSLNSRLEQEIFLSNLEKAKNDPDPYEDRGSYFSNYLIAEIQSYAFYEQFELEIKLPLLSDKNKIVSPYKSLFDEKTWNEKADTLTSYESKSSNALYNYLSKQKDKIAISIYIKPKFSISGKREFVYSLMYIEIYWRLIRENYELFNWNDRFINQDFNLNLHSYLHPTTNERIIYTNTEDLLPLKKIINVQTNELEKALIKESYSFLITYKIDPKHPLNQSFTKENENLAEEIIERWKWKPEEVNIENYEDVKNGIRIYEEKLPRVAMKIETLNKKLEELYQSNPNWTDNVYFVTRKLYYYNVEKERVSHKEVGNNTELLLYAKTNEKDVFVAAFPMRDIIANVLATRRDYITYPIVWTNPLDITDRRTYTQVLLNGWYHGEMINYVDIEKQEEKKIEREADLSSVKEKYAEFPILTKDILKYEHLFTIKDTQSSKYDSTYQHIGLKDRVSYRYITEGICNYCELLPITFYSVSRDSLVLTKISYLLEDDKKAKVAVLLKKIDAATRAGILRPYQGDTLWNREKNYDVQWEKLKTPYNQLIENEKLIDQQLEIELTIPLASNRKNIGSVLYPYKSQMDITGMGILIYIKPNFSKTGQRELLCSYRFSEFDQNEMRDNPTLKEWEERFNNFKSKPYSYINPLTGKKVILNTKEDLLPLSEMLKVEVKELKKLLTNPKL
jgi:hypothetical protein